MENKQMSPRFDADSAITTIQRFITGRLLASGMNGFVVGLSGGIDSAVAASLAVRALDKDKLLGVLMPYRSSSESSVSDARELVASLGIESRRIDISPMIDTYFGDSDRIDRVRAGNKMARERMSILFDIAQETGRLVLGTGNRTEICLGYTTWYGDSACSLNPIGELYKTEVREIARKIGVPEMIIAKPPSADLWAGQTDEGEIGVSYGTIDAILKKMVDEGVRSMRELTDDGFDETDVSRVVSLLNRNAFKRRLPDIAPLNRPGIPENIRLEV